MKHKNVAATVVNILGICAVLSIAGSLILAYFGKTVPETITNIAVAAVGALSAILANIKMPFTDSDPSKNSPQNAKNEESGN